MKQMTFGLIIGNRGFFPDHLAKSGREEMIRAVEAAGMKAVVLGPEDSKYGAVETRPEAAACAALFKRHAGEIDGIIVSLPNFGDERTVAETIHMAALGVPVLVQATPDTPGQMTLKDRRDSFCGKMSVCNNLRQYGIPFSLTSSHTVHPDSEAFRADLNWFAAVCRVVNGLRQTRVGAVGARPAAFNTVRYSEKLLQGSGIAVETLDLFDLFGRVERLKDGDVQKQLEAIKQYAPAQGVPEESLTKMAKLAAALEQWTEETGVNITALQCWTAMEEFYGVVPCAVMSMLSNRLLSSACEVDVCGAVAMHSLVLASGTPSALLDWNNNYDDDPDKAVCFHCSNLPKSFFKEVHIDFQAIIAGSVGKEKSYGTCVGYIKPGPMTYARLSTDDAQGRIRAYLGAGEFTDDPLDTFGGSGVVRIPRMQQLLRYICENGFEHHVAASHSTCAAAVEEAWKRYFGWEVYHHAAA